MADKPKFTSKSTTRPFGPLTRGRVSDVPRSRGVRRVYHPGGDPLLGRPYDDEPQITPGRLSRIGERVHDFISRRGRLIPR